MPSQIVLGNLNTLIEYVGMAWATVLISTSRPALEMNFSFHPITRFDIFSWISLNVLTLDLPHVMGKPR